MIFLFNANDINYSSYYSHDIERRIWGCNLLQPVENELTIYQGDIITVPYVETVNQLQELLNKILIDAEETYLKKDILTYVFTYENVFAWSIKGLSDELSLGLHEMLWSDTGYLGMLKMNDDNIVHRLLFNDFLVKKYILCNYQVKVIAEIEEENEYIGIIDFLKRMGFQNVVLTEDVYELYRKN